MTTATEKFHIPAQLFRGALRADEAKYVESGRSLLEYTCACLGLENFADCDVLDVGCGTKFTQAMLDYRLPIKQYTGIDVYLEMIEYLQQHVNDPRFSYYHMDTHNEMYNPSGKPLSGNTVLPVGDKLFDVICFFSVFTHLAPHDYRAMLQLVRPYIRDSGRLLFSLYVDEVSGNGYGLMERIAEDLGVAVEPSGEPFRDAYPGKPLQWALYSRDYAFELIEGTGWQVEELHLPNEFIQHHFVCTPA